MKKALILALVIGTVFAMVPAHASHNPRTVEGSILVTTVTVPGQGTFSRQARCAFLAVGHAADGLFGYVVDIDAAEADGAHEFTATSGTAGSDVGVVFYETLGSCDNTVVGAPVVAGEFLTPGADEAGFIPEFATIAIIVQEGVVDGAFNFSIS